MSSLVKEMFGVIKRKFPCDQTSLYLPDQSYDYCIVFTANPTAKDDEIQYRSIESKQGILYRTLEHGEIYCCNSITPPQEADQLWYSPHEEYLYQDGIRSYAYIPINFEHKTIACLLLGSYKTDTFQTAKLNRLSEQLSPFADVLKITQDHEQKWYLSEKTTVLTQVSKTLVQTRNPQKAFQKITPLIRALFNADFCVFNEYHPDKRTFTPRYYEGSDPERGKFLLSLEFERESLPVAELLFKADKPIVVENVPRSHLIPDDLVKMFDVKSGMNLPFRIGNDVIGSMIIAYTRDFHRFTEEEISLSSEILTLVTVAFENARLFEQQEEKNRVFQSLVRIAKILTQAIEPSKVFHRIVSTTHVSVHSDQCILLKWNAAKGVFHPEYMTGIPETLKVLVDSERFIREPQILYREFYQQNKIIAWEKNQPPKFLPEIWYDLTRIRQVYWIPLVSKDKLLGALYVAYVDSIPPTTSELTGLLEGIAQYASIALENAALLEANESRTREMEILTDIGKTITGITEPDKLLPEIYEQIRRIVHCDTFYISLYHPENNTVFIPYLIDDGIIFPPQTHDILGDDHINKVLATGKPLLIERTLNPETGQQILNDPHGFAPLGNHQKMSTSLIYLPLRIKNTIMGFMSVQSYRPGVYKKYHLEILSGVGAQAAIALDNANHLKQQQEAIHRLEMIARISTSSTENLSFSDRMQQMIALVQESFAVDACIIRKLEGTHLKLVTSAGVDPHLLIPNMNSKEGISREIIISKKPVQYTDVKNNPALLFLQQVSYNKFPFISYLGVPMMLKGDIKGILGIYTTKAVKIFSEQDVQHLQIIANYIAVIVDNAGLSEEQDKFIAQLKAVYSVTEAGYTANTFDEMMKLLMDSMIQLTHADAGTLFLLDEYTHELELKAYSGFPDTLKNLRLEPGAGFAGEVLLHNKVLTAKNITQRSDFAKEIGVTIPIIRSTLGVPIRSGNRVLGVAHLDSFTPREFTEWEISVFETLGTKVGLLIENRQLAMEASRKAQTLLLLQEAYARELNILKIPELYHAIIKVVSGIVGADISILMMRSETTHQIEPISLWGDSEKINTLKNHLSVFQDESIYQRVFKNGNSYFSKDLSQDPVLQPLSRKDILQNTAMLVPLKNEIGVWGMICLFRNNPTYTNFDLQMVELFSRQASLNIQTARLFSRIQDTEEKYRSLVENSNDAVFILSLQRKFIYANDATLSLTGYPWSELKKMTFDQLLEAPGESSLKSSPENTLDILNVTHPQEFIFHRKDSTQVPIEINSQIIREDAHPFGVQSIVRDITERKRRERQILEILEVTRSFKLTSGVETFLSRCLEGTSKLLEPKTYSFIWILLVNEETNHLNKRAQRLSSEADISPEYQQDAVTISWSTYQSGDSRLIEKSTPEEHIIPSAISVPIKIKDKIMGVMFVGSTSPQIEHQYAREDLSMIELMANHIAMALEKHGLYDDLEKHYLQTVRSLARAVDIRDSYTLDHSNETARMATTLAQRLELPEFEIPIIETAALLHDVGKIGIPDSILGKPGQLSDHEYKEIQKHPELGAEILKPLIEMGDVSNLVLHHQEHYDGSGYPNHLKGEEIPMGSRILSVVDAYQAMITDRVYRKSLGKEYAIEELKRYSGIYFDPQVVNVFLQILEEGHY